MKPRVLFFNGTLGAGGAERVMAMLANKLYVNGENVEILLYHNDPVFFKINDGIRIIRVSELSNSKSYIKNLLRIRKYISKHADLVISFNASMNIYILLSTLGLRIKKIVADRNDPRYMPKKSHMRIVRNMLYHFADGIVIQNTHNLVYFDKSIQRKSTIIYNPVDMGEYIGKALVTPKRKRIVTVGRTTYQKNQKILIDAFSSVIKKHPDYSLSIYGEGPLREELRDYARTLGIDEYVDLPGAVNDVYDYIIDADAFVMTSKYEGMPNALIEAMVLGLPVISTKVSGATDLIKDGENGLLIDHDDIKQLVDALLLFIENENISKQCAQEAIKVADLLRIDLIIEQWQKFIYSVIDYK